MTAEESKAVVQKWDAAVSQKDLGFLDAHPGLIEAKPFFAELFAAFPDFKVTVHHTMVDGDWVAERLMASGTHQATFMGIPATGKHASWSVLTMNRVVNGKIVESYGQADDLDMMKQLGVSSGAGGPPQP